MPKTQKSNKKNDQHDKQVEFVVTRFEKSWNYTQPNYHARWEDAWKLYNNKRIKRGYDGVSDVFVPMTFSTIETMVSALAGGKPSFDFIPPEEKNGQETDVLNAKVDEYWDKDQWNIKIQNLIRSMLVYGTGVAYLYWNIDHPVMVNVPLRDFFFDPNAVNIEGCSTGFYAGRRYLTTKEDLESFEVVDPETQELVKKYKNIDQIKAGKHGDETDKEKKDMFYGSTVSDAEHSQIEILELWTEDRVISVANRSVLIQDDENPYLTQSKEVYGDDKAKGIIPFVIQRDYVDESLFLGRGEVEIIADLQEDLNDLTNQKRDFLSFILNPMWNLDPTKIDMIEQIEAAPGVVFPLKQSDLTPVLMPQLPNAAFNEEINIENKIREATAVDQVVKGVGQDSDTTATEVNAQIASAGQRIGMKVTQLENEGFHRLGRIVFEMMRLYTNGPQLIQVTTDRSQYKMFDPQEFSGNYDLKVQLSTTVDATKQREVKQYQEMYLALGQDPMVNQEELKRIVLPKLFDLDPDEIDRLLDVPEPMMPGMGGGMDAEMPMEAPAPEMGMM